MMSVVTGTKLMNNNEFNGDSILTPMFQPTSAMTPGYIIINNKCGLADITASPMERIYTQITSPLRQ